MWMFFCFFQQGGAGFFNAEIHFTTASRAQSSLVQQKLVNIRARHCGLDPQRGKKNRAFMAKKKYYRYNKKNLYIRTLKTRTLNYF